MLSRLFSKKNSESSFNPKEVIKSLGLVFGDIGTSPIYTISIVFLTIPVTLNNIMGVLSLITWTLLLLVIVQYSFLAMNLSKKGEGGTIVLKEILVPLLKTNRQVIVVTFLSFIGVSLFFGDGVITPAISILSAVEGLQLIPGLEGLANSKTTLIFIAAIIAFLLFLFQKKGTDKVSAAFGPIMIVWFASIAISGILTLIHSPQLLLSLSPFYAIKFLLTNGFAGFIVLSEVILCATGGEALYADMGHLGKKPIQHATALVLPALLLSYFGQGAFLLQNPKVEGFVLYKMILSQASFLYIPFLLLGVAATVIASQAMISGLFSIVYQGIVTKLLPNFKIDYTSTKFRSQIYLGFVNWFLFIAVILIMFRFKSAHGLAYAYGLAATGTMTITGIMMTTIFYQRKSYWVSSLAGCLTVLNFCYFCSNSLKIPNGGYWSIILALLPLSIILIYTRGQKKMASCLTPMPLENFLTKYNDVYTQKSHIEGTALFFVKDLQDVSPYIVQTMFKNNILYEDNIIISIITRDDPFGVIGFFKGELAPGLRIFEIHMGYMEIINIEKILHNAGINAKVIFYGLEDIETKNFAWKFYSFIKRITPSFVRFHKLPPYKLHGVVNLVEMK